jgi:RNA methyltransferase, TrmH family
LRHIRRRKTGLTFIIDPEIMAHNLQRCSKSLILDYARLTQKKYRLSEGKFLLEGVRAVEEVLNSSWEVEMLLVRDETVLEQFTPLLGRRPVPVGLAAEKDLARLSDTVTSQGAVCVVKIPPQPPVGEIFSREGPLSVLALNGVADPGNVGTIIRTSDWFGVSAVVLDPSTVELTNPKVLRSAMGSEFHLPVVTSTGLDSLIALARQHEIPVITTTLQGGESASTYRFPERFLLVMGSEAHGVDGSVAAGGDVRLTIPRFGNAESLNVAISTGILLALMAMRR